MPRRLVRRITGGASELVQLQRLSGCPAWQLALVNGRGNRAKHRAPGKLHCHQRWVFFYPAKCQLFSTTSQLVCATDLQHASSISPTPQSGSTRHELYAYTQYYCSGRPAVYELRSGVHFAVSQVNGRSNDNRRVSLPPDYRSDCGCWQSEGFDCLNL
ncbi:hypothetical protein ABZP36_017441 [Zizania latifolia]